MVKLTTWIWVEAYRARLQQQAIPVFVVSKGDETAGAVLVKLNTLDGDAEAFSRSTGPDGEAMWTTLRKGPEPDVDAAIARQRDFDPDLWVLEIEDRAGRTLLDQDGLR